MLYTIDPNKNFYTYFTSGGNGNISKEAFKKVDEQSYFDEKNLSFCLLIPYMKVANIDSNNELNSTLFYEISFDYLFNYYKETNKFQITFSNENKPVFNISTITLNTALVTLEKSEKIQSFNIQECSIFDALDNIGNNLIPSVFDSIAKKPKPFFTDYLSLSTENYFFPMLHALQKNYTSSFNILIQCLKSNDFSPIINYQPSSIDMINKLRTNLDVLNVYQLHQDISSDFSHVNNDENTLSLSKPKHKL